jgi:hypothetical protein
MGIKSYSGVSPMLRSARQDRYQGMRVEIVMVVESGKDQCLLDTPRLRKSVVISDGPPVTTDLIRFDA